MRYNSKYVRERKDSFMTGRWAWSVSRVVEPILARLNLVRSTSKCCSLACRASDLSVLND